MGDNSAIEWTDCTWNLASGCTKVSPACHVCYIDRTPPFRIAGRRFDGEGVGASTDLILHPERLHWPLRWRRPRLVFVNSLSDVFHEQIEDSYLVEMFAVMALAPRHTFQVLTKRHGRMRSLLGSDAFRDAVATEVDRLATMEKSPVEPRVRDAVRSRVAKWLDPLPGGRWPLPNVWLGVTVEDQKWADIRIPALLRTPAAVRFLSCEPLLGPVSLHRYLPNGYGEGALHNPTHSPLPQHALPTLDWVITGGESGPKARPTNPEWVRTLRDQCTASGIAYFHKQWGEWAPDGHFTGHLNALGRDQHAFEGSTDPRFTHTVVRRVGKKAAGRLLDGRTWDERPRQPREPVVQ